MYSKLIKFDFQYLKFNKKYVIELLKLGIPVVLQEWIIAGIFVLEVNVSNADGVIGSASYGVVNKLEEILRIIGGAYRTMIIVTVGQFIGNKKTNEIKNIMKQGLKLAVFPIILTMLIVFVFPKEFCRVFVSSEAVVEKAYLYLMIMSFTLIVTPFRQLLRGVIIGSGHTKFSLIQIVFSMSVEIISLIALKNNGINGLMAIGIAITICVASELIINTIYYFSNNWKKEVIK